MKNMLLCLALCVGSRLSHAQLALTPEVGLNIASQVGEYRDGNSFKRIERLKSVSGLRAGTGFYIGIAGGFFFQPGLFYAHKGVTQSIRYGSSLITDTEIRCHSLELPLDLGYEYRFGKAGSAFITAGAYLGYTFSGKQHDKVTLGGILRDELETNIVFNDERDASSRKSFETGMSFSAGYKLPVGLYLRFLYGLGLSNTMMLDEELRMKNRTWSVTAGYMLRFKRK